MAFTENRTTTSIFIPNPLDILRLLRKWNTRRIKRDQMAVLLEQEDWVLKDMGITRGDVHEALSHHDNPALHLKALAARRRFWSRGREQL